MYRYIIDVRYKKNEDSEDSAIVANTFRKIFSEFQVLQDNHDRTEILIELENLKEADNMSMQLVKLKRELLSSTTIDCYVVSGKWSITC